MGRQGPVARTARAVLGTMAAVVAWVAMAAPSHAEYVIYGDFAFNTEFPEELYFNGDIGVGDYDDLRAALDQYPTINVLFLESPGGELADAALMVVAVQSAGLSTVVLPGDRCMSACAVVFLAGTNRLAAGLLGVHQILAPGDQGAQQQSIARYVGVLSDLGAHPEVIAAALSTPPEDMYVFTRSELEEWELNRGAGPLADRFAIPLVTPSERDRAMADLERYVSDYLAREDELRAEFLEANPDATRGWEVRWAMTHTLMSAEQFPEYAVRTAVDEGLPLDNLASSAALGASVVVNAMSGGFVRLSADDLLLFFDLQVRAINLVAESNPELCAAAEDALLTEVFLRKLDRAEFDQLVGMYTRAILAELNDVSPQVDSNPTRALAAGYALDQELVELASQSPVAAELLAYGVDSIEDTCALTELLTTAMASLDEDLRVELILQSMLGILEEAGR